MLECSLHNMAMKTIPPYGHLQRMFHLIVVLSITLLALCVIKVHVFKTESWLPSALSDLAVKDTVGDVNITLESTEELNSQESDLSESSLSYSSDSETTPDTSKLKSSEPSTPKAKIVIISPSLKRRTCSLEDRQVKPHPDIYNIAFASVGQPDQDLLDALMATTKFGSISIYTRKLIKVKKHNFVTTSHPMRKTEAMPNRNDYNASVVQLLHPLHYILEMYRKEYNANITDKTIYSSLFKQYVLAKAELWRRFVLHWMNRYLDSPSRVSLLPVGARASEQQLARAYQMLRISNAGPLVQYLRCTLDNDLLDLRGSAPLHENEAFYKAHGDKLKSLICSQLNDEFKKLREAGVDWSKSSSSFFSCDDGNVAEPHSTTVNILTTMFRSAHEERQVELDYAFVRNVNNKNIDKIHVLIEGSQIVIPNDTANEIGERIKVVQVEKQPLYSDFFTYANKNLNKQIVIIQNNDIFWPEESAKLLKESLRPGMVFALSRHNNVTSEPASVCTSKKANEKYV